MAQDEEPVKAGGVIQIDERPIRDHVDQVVRATVEETLNQLLDAEADRLCGAGRYERSADRVRHAGRQLPQATRDQSRRGDPEGPEAADAAL